MRDLRRRESPNQDMERRSPGPTWRASVGLSITVIAAVLLLAALFQVARLNSEAGSDVATLSREREAVQYQQSLMPLYVDLNEYRMQIDSLKPPASDRDLRPRIDREIADANA